MRPELTDLSTFRKLLADAPQKDLNGRQRASERNGQLTKPPGSLGRLEEIAIWYSEWQPRERPEINAPQVIIFAGNHGVARQGVSAFPPEVTEQMVANFQHGGAAINQLSNAAGAKLNVHALELDRPTEDFTQCPAMTEQELLQALQLGWDAVDKNADLLVVGEMGIGNTTSAAAICHALFGGQPSDWTGRGTGVDEEGMEIKNRVVAEGVALHSATNTDGLDVLRCLGGREIAAMVGAIAVARQLKIPVLLDGFICCAAAACLHALDPGALDHTLAGHLSAEGGHQSVLDRLGKEPILSLGLRLGEGSGAALAINIVRSALACHSGMATFAEAGVAEG